MQFLYPYFLWALAIIAIPIIIHLFYFRRFKKVYFTNVRFLKDIKEETAARSKLRNLLVLLSRILALVALVLAFCLPFLKDDEARIGKKASSIFIDNSFSMEAKASDVILLEKAKNYAREVINSHNEDDVIQILTHDFEGQHQRLVDKEEALNLVEDIVISPSSRSLSDISKRQKQLLSKENVEFRNLYWISDFQKSMVNLDSLIDTSFQHYALPLQSVEESNISIDSAWFSSPVVRLNEPNTVFVKMTNRGNSTAENVRLAAMHDGQEKPISVVDLSPGATLIDTFNLSVSKAGWQNLQVQLTDHPVTFDDRYHLSFQVADKINILTLGETNTSTSLIKALESISSIVATKQLVKQVDYSQLSKQNMVILDGVMSISTGLTNALRGYVSNGGNVLIFPPKNADITQFNLLLKALNTDQLVSWNETSREVSSINTDEFVFKDVFSVINRNVRLPNTSGAYTLDRSGKNKETLLRYRDGESYIGKYVLDKGRTYLCSAPLEKALNTLVKDAEIFIPMVYKMALSSSDDTPMAYTIGNDELIEVQGQWDLEDRTLEIKGQTNFIPGMTRVGGSTMLNINNQVQKDGVYDLVSKEETIQKLAFNYDRTESELQFFLPEELEKKWGQNVRLIESNNQSQLAQVLKESEEGQPLWKWLLIFTLIFLAIEQLLLRLWKV